MKGRTILFATAAALLVLTLLALMGGREPEGGFQFLAPVSAKFADYIPVEVSYHPSVSPYSLSRDLSNVKNLGDFVLSKWEEDALRDRGFFARSSYDPEMYKGYESLKERNIPIFVTTDSLLHAYHVLYDYVLREAEASRLVTLLKDLTEYLSRASEDQYSAIENSRLTEAARLNVAYFCVAGRLLDPSFAVPDYVEEEVDSELTLIRQHGGFAVSPVFGVKEDYSQYVPRGHYTRSEELKAYFRAMMWYGRMTFTLRMGPDEGSIEIGRRHTRQALLIASSLSTGSVNGVPALRVWEDVYEPTTFFVGRTDDLNIYDYLDLARSLRRSGKPEEDLSSDEWVDSFISKALELRKPKISSTGSTANMQGFRFMGQRFIPDSYILQEVVYNKTSRLMPKGLDVMSALGSERAWWHLRDEWASYNYKEQMEKLKREFASMTVDNWTQNLYWLWLYTLRPLLTPASEGYPSFMLNDAWTDKELLTALGSWTELRHDTILYAKQSYTERTSVPLQPTLTKGYVEPLPEVYGRLASLARMTRDGLVSRGLLSEEFERRLDTMEELSRMLMEISAKELEEKPLTEEEYEAIWNIGSTLEGIVTIPAEMSSIATDTDSRMPIVADVHTDPNTGTVLEEATGYPLLIHVVVPVEGKLYIAAGACFSYCEFGQPLSNRLTDEAWQDLLNKGSAPPMPSWAESIFPSGRI